MRVAGAGKKARAGSAAAGSAGGGSGAAGSAGGGSGAAGSAGRGSGAAGSAGGGSGAAGSAGGGSGADGSAGGGSAAAAGGGASVGGAALLLVVYILTPLNFRVAVKWWLGLDTSQGSQDTLVHFLHRAYASVQVEVGAGFFPTIRSQDLPNSLQNWNLGRPVALDISVVSPLNPSTLAEAGATFGAVLETTESRKHQANDEKCSALGGYIVLAQVAARLAIHKSLPKSQASFDLFSNLSICLIRANARAILRRV
eukprot:Em0442g2a